MPPGRLTQFQVRVLELLAGLKPTWTLTGGGALVGVYLGHRTTRDLDLFVHGARTLSDFPVKVKERLIAAKLAAMAAVSGTNNGRAGSPWRSVATIRSNSAMSRPMSAPASGSPPRPTSCAR